jgi:hypothetical protein
MKLPSESLAMPVQGLSLGLLYEHDCFGRASRHLLATADYDAGLNASPATSTPIIMTVLNYLVISGFAKADRYASLDIQFRPFYTYVWISSMGGIGDIICRCSLRMHVILYSLLILPKIISVWFS